MSRAKFSLYPVDFQFRYIHTGDRVNFKRDRYIVGKIDKKLFTLELWTPVDDDNDISMSFKIIDQPLESQSLIRCKKIKQIKIKKEKNQ